MNKTLDEILEIARISYGGKKMKSVIMIALDENDETTVLMSGRKDLMKYSLTVSAGKNPDMRNIVDYTSAMLARIDAREQARDRARQQFLKQVENLFEQDNG